MKERVFLALAGVWTIAVTLTWGLLAVWVAVTWG